MIVREILSVLHADQDNRSVLAFSGWLGASFGADVRGLCLLPSPAPGNAECYALGQVAMAGVSRHLEKEAAVVAAPCRAMFQHMLEDYRVDGDWTCIERFEAVDIAPLYTRFVDLVVAARPDKADRAGRQLADALLLYGTAPCLLVPPSALPEPFNRITIAWDGSREAKHAVDDALPLLKRAEAVQLVTFGEAAEARAGDRPDAFEMHLARHGVASEVDHRPRCRQTATHILERCQDFRSNLLVMGAYGRSKRVEALFGGVTHDMLPSASLPVFTRC